MRFATINRLSSSDLRAMAQGALPDTITDMDFLETLAGQRCLIAPPWILQTTPDGQLRKVVRLTYTVDGEIDKARVLLLLARKLRQARLNDRFGGRLSL